MSRLPRMLSALLLLAGAIAWLLGPGAPAQPRGAGAAAAATDPAEEGPWTAEVWLEGEAEDSEEPAQQATEAQPVRTVEAERSEPAQGPAPGPPDADAGLDLVRRMLAIHARMREP